MCKINIYSDGASKGNPGRGGWGTIVQILLSGEEIYTSYEYTGANKSTTNNQMELTAAIKGFEHMDKLVPKDEEHRILVYTDSKYISNAFEDGWIQTWINNGWKRPKNKELSNKNLWKELYGWVTKYPAKFIWVKGHNGHFENERCDTLASLSAEGIQWMLSDDGRTLEYQT